MSFHFRKVEKGEQIELKVSRRKRKISFRTETNEIGNRKTKEKKPTKQNQKIGSL